MGQKKSGAGQEVFYGSNKERSGKACGARMRHPLESDNTEFTSVLSHPIKYKRYFMGPKKSRAGKVA